MRHLFKHLAVRLWTTLVIGSLAALTALQPVAGLIGPGWMIVPGIGLLILVFWLTGAAFGAVGRHRMAHLLKEAAVWERAGMLREAAHSLGRAGAIVDSYLFSPFSRRRPAAELLARTARFQMAQDRGGPADEAIMGPYLQHFPTDRVAAVRWLDSLLAGIDKLVAEGILLTQIRVMLHPQAESAAMRYSYRDNDLAVAWRLSPSSGENGQSLEDGYNAGEIIQRFVQSEEAQP